MNYRIWGEQFDGPGLLLVHGNTANSHWWDHVAPELATDRRVVAMDLTGFGDSAHRPAYGFTVWANDIRAVLREALAPGSVIVAHSMGGKPGYQAALTEPSVGGLVLLDSNIGRMPAADRARLMADRADSQARVFATLDDAVRAYRLFRPVDSSIDVPSYLVEHIARNSVRQVPGGWGWKFDQAVYRAALEPPTPVRPLSCPVAVVRAGEHSVLDDESYTDLLRDLGSGTVTATVESSGHHVMLDDPLALIDLVQKIVRDWI
ncbi:MAG: alpha/beta hydrolase [Aldersonia sp.]|nr:alpha/beta hydrolase [Aldersonia sp.]